MLWRYIYKYILVCIYISGLFLVSFKHMYLAKVFLASLTDVELQRMMCCKLCLCNWDGLIWTIQCRTYINCPQWCSHVAFSELQIWVPSSALLFRVLGLYTIDPSYNTTFQNHMKCHIILIVCIERSKFCVGLWPLAVYIGGSCQTGGSSSFKTAGREFSLYLCTYSVPLKQL